MDAPLDNQADPSGPNGRPSPPTALVAQLYDELREMARRQMSRERPGQTLQTTALVHEAFMRVGGQWPGPDSSGGRTRTQQFFQAAAIAMRRILVDRARARRRLKRGGGAARVPLDDSDLATNEESVDWLALDEALKKLEAHDQELAELVSLRYFAGLSVDQAAAALGVSPRTIDRNWRLARAFLQRELIDGAAE